jgi:hypothetical protein
MQTKKTLTAAEIGYYGERHATAWLTANGYACYQNTQLPGSTDNALGHGLANALPPSPYKMPSLVDPVFTKLMVDRGFEAKNAPWVSVGLDPDLITVLIGAHP